MHLTQIKLLKKALKKVNWLKKVLKKSLKKVHLLKKVLWKVKLLKKVAQKSYSTKKLFSKGPKKGLLKVDLLKKVILKKAGKSHKIYKILQNIKLFLFEVGAKHLGWVVPTLYKLWPDRSGTYTVVSTTSIVASIYSIPFRHQGPKGPQTKATTHPLQILAR